MAKCAIGAEHDILALQYKFRLDITITSDELKELSLDSLNSLSVALSTGDIKVSHKLLVMSQLFKQLGR